MSFGHWNFLLNKQKITCFEYLNTKILFIAIDTEKKTIFLWVSDMKERLWKQYKWENIILKINWLKSKGRHQRSYLIFCSEWKRKLSIELESHRFWMSAYFSIHELLNDFNPFGKVTLNNPFYYSNIDDLKWKFEIESLLLRFMRF